MITQDDVDAMCGVHESHSMRYSDSSYFDEICGNCMQPDWCTNENIKLRLPCGGKPEFTDATR